MKNNINPTEAWATLCNKYPVTIIEAIRLLRIVIAGLKEDIESIEPLTAEQMQEILDILQ